jgi:hypothetical protein
MRSKGLLYGILLVACWSTAAVAITGDQIADQALIYNGQCCWQCKVFVQRVLADLGQTLDWGYQDCYLAIADEIYNPDQVRRGDLGQVSNDINPADDSYTHSFIVLENRGDEMMYVIHSNWRPPYEETVSTDVKNFRDWATQWPGWSVHYYRLKALNVGNWQNGGFSQPIYDCFIRNGGFSKVGRPYDDGAGVYVHNWLPYSYVCQNFINDKGEQSIIMYDPSSSGQAYLVSGLTWEMYRRGFLGHYGPGIMLPNGKFLGCPTGDEHACIQTFKMATTSSALCTKVHRAKSRCQQLKRLPRQLSSSFISLTARWLTPMVRPANCQP